jgi:hypothetical protein
MTTNHTDEKKPARGGLLAGRVFEKPRIHRVVQYTTFADHWPIVRIESLRWECRGMGCVEVGASPNHAYMNWRRAVGPLNLREQLTLWLSPWKLPWGGWLSDRYY